ncbi:MAG: hypothetical protein RLZZ501_2406, partial [Pseudomonadota bacterium]
MADREWYPGPEGGGEESAGVGVGRDRAALSFEAALEDGLGRAVALGQAMLRRAQGARLSDLAAGMVDLVERGLDQREAALRQWAAEAALCSGFEGAAAAARAARRLAAILSCYGGLRDLWLLDPAGRVIARGAGASAFAGDGAVAVLAAQPWFGAALAGRVASALMPVAGEDGVRTLPLAAPVWGGDGSVRGVLAARLDWRGLAGTVVQRARQRRESGASARCLLLAPDRRVIAASDGSAADEVFPLAGA